MRRFARGISGVCLAALALAVLAWTIGRLANDRFLWSQYVFWIPEELSLAGTLALLLAAWGFSRLGRGPHPRRRQRRWAIASGLVAVMSVHLIAIHWRLQNLLTRPAPRATRNTLRILAWNATAVERTEQITDPVYGQHPDAAVIVDPHSRVGWHDVFANFGDPAEVIWHDEFIVLSHIHILRHGSLRLGLENVPPEITGPGFLRTSMVDPGRATFFELDTTEKFGRTTVVWVIDMPSDWRLSRWSLAAHAAAAIAAWTGPEMIHDPSGGTTARDGGPGFPAPDIVLGDFNAPRGSASISLIAPGMADAFDQAGAGYTASWPGQHFGHIPYPILHLDQMFVAPWLRAVRYDIVRPIFGFHWPQVADIVARDQTPRTR